MSAVVCPRCWNYYSSDKQACGECGGQLIVAERHGVYRGGSLDFAAETTPGIFAALEFVDVVTLVRAVLIVNALLIGLLIHLAVGSQHIAYGFFGQNVGDLLYQQKSSIMNYVEIGWGVFAAFSLLAVRFRMARLVAMIFWGMAGVAATFFAITKTTEPLGFLTILSTFALSAICWFSNRGE